MHALEVVTASDSLTMSSDEAAVVADNGSAMQADRDVTVTAGTDARFDNASLDAVNGNARITASDGALTLANNAGLTAGADLDANAGGKITMDATSAMNSGIKGAAINSQIAASQLSQNTTTR